MAGKVTLPDHPRLAKVLPQSRQGIFDSADFVALRWSQISEFDQLGDQLRRRKPRRRSSHAVYPASRPTDTRLDIVTQLSSQARTL